MQDDAGARIGELTRQGQAAVAAVAQRLGLPVADAAILSSRGSLLVHLGPAPVVARVSTLSAWSRSDPFAWLAQEVAVAGYIAARGGPVTRPASGVDPGPHWQDGFAVSLWEYIPDLALRPGPAEAGLPLARLHAAARDCPAELGDLSPARELISDGLAALDRDGVVDRGTLAALRSVHADILAGLADHADGAIVLHGDAHAGNLLAAAGRGWLWIDLEETCRGPVAWDLATLSVHYPADEGQAALRSYAAAAGTVVPDDAALAPFRRARELEGAVWSLCMAHLFQARYADVARRLLATVLARRLLATVLAR